MTPRRGGASAHPFAQPERFVPLGRYQVFRLRDWGRWPAAGVGGVAPC